MEPSDIGRQAPRGLFSRIMRRLGLERQLVLVRRNLGVVLMSLAGAFAGTVLVVWAIRDFLRHSGFGPYLSLARSDSGFVIHHWQPFFLALSESAPAVFFAIGLFAVAGLLICIRFAVLMAERIHRLHGTIRHS